MGALTTALFFFYMFAAPASGWLGDRFRRKPLIITGAVLWSLATLGSGFVHSYWSSLYPARAGRRGRGDIRNLCSCGAGGFLPGARAQRILSIFYLAIPVGAALGYVAGGELGSLWGWRGPFLICAIPGLIVAALYGGLRARAGARRHG